MRWQDRPLPDRQIAVFEATGRELLDLATLGDRDWWIFRPLPDSATVDPDGTYHIAGPLEVIIPGPGSRRVSPRNVRLISDESTIEATFREVWGVKRR